MSLFSFFRGKYHENKRKKAIKYVSLGKGTFLLPDCSIDLRNPTKGKKYLLAGEDNLIGGNFVFEKETGVVNIGNHCHIGGSEFISVNNITVGDYVTIGFSSLFYDHDSHSIDYKDRVHDIVQETLDYENDGNLIENKDWSTVKSAPIVLKNHSWIGARCIILKGVTIGEGSIVGAGSVVTHDVPDWVMVAGNPAVIKKNLR